MQYHSFDSDSDSEHAGNVIMFVSIAIGSFVLIWCLTTACRAAARETERGAQQPTLVQYHQQNMEPPAHYVVQSEGSGAYLQPVYYNTSETGYVQTVGTGHHSPTVVYNPSQTAMYAAAQTPFLPTSTPPHDATCSVADHNPHRMV